MLRQLAFLLALGITAPTLSAHPPAALPAPTTDQLHQWLETSARRSNLITEGSQPFHLVATFERFENGQFMGKGSFDILWRDPLSYKETIILPERRKEPLLEVDNGKSAWRVGDWSFPYGVLNAQGLMLLPVPPQDITTHRLYFEPHHANIENLDCIAREPEIAGAPETLSIARTTYCLARGNHLVRYIDMPGNITFHLDDIEPFANKYIARTITITRLSSSQPIILLHIDKLETPTDFTPLDEQPRPKAQILAQARPLITINQGSSGALMPGQLLYAPPLNTETFMVNKIDDAVPLGSIQLLLHVATDGTVASADIIHSSDIHLNPIAIQWAKKARFRAGYQGNRLVPFDFSYLLNFGGPDH